MSRIAIFVRIVFCPSLAATAGTIPTPADQSTAQACLSLSVSQIIDAGLSRPFGVAVDSAGNEYVAACFSDSVFEITRTAQSPKSSTPPATGAAISFALLQGQKWTPCATYVWLASTVSMLSRSHRWARGGMKPCPRAGRSSRLLYLRADRAFAAVQIKEHTPC